MIDASKVEIAKKKFFSDPEWHVVEEIILEYIKPLVDMSTVDTSKPAEDVKGQIIGRLMAYDSLYKFVEGTQILGRQRLDTLKPPSFK